MEKIKRALSLLLCFVMVAGLMPMSVFATEGAVADISPMAEAGSNYGEGYLSSGKNYVLDTDGIETNGKYIIVSQYNGKFYALALNEITKNEVKNGTLEQEISVTAVEVTVSADGTSLSVADDDKLAMSFSASEGAATVTHNSVEFAELSNAAFEAGGDCKFKYKASEAAKQVYVEVSGNGQYSIWKAKNGQKDKNCLIYNGTKWTESGTATPVYLFKYDGDSAAEEVTFTVEPASVVMQPNSTAALSAVATVAGNSADKLTIKWESDENSVSVDSNGQITSGADEVTATITATLTAVDGKTVANGGIKVTIPVTVASKQLDDSFTPVLTGNTPVTVKKGETPDFSNIKLEVKFEDDESITIITTANGLVIEGYDASTPGTYFAKISYKGTEYGTVAVIVEGNPYEGKDEATTYPEYPADGAVRIDKTAEELEFQTTGLVQVELDVAGISVKQGLDVVLVVDVSNSMGWSLEDAGSDTDSDRVADEGEINKLEYAMIAASDFADILLQDNKGGPSDNTLSFVTFAGYDSTFGKDDTDTKNGVVDSLMEVFQRETSSDAAKVSFKGTMFEVGNTNYHLTITDNKGQVLVDGPNRGDTNYDYAFWQATQTVNSIKDYNEANGQGGREVFIVFMTDGAPSHYNGLNKDGASGRADNWPDNKTSYKKDNNYTSSQDAWYGYFSSQANNYAKELYEEVNGNMVAIGFDLAHGGFKGWQWTEEELSAALKQVAHDTKEIEVHATAEKDELANIFADVANKIRYAGTQANVTDTINSEFTLQMDNTVGTANMGIGEMTLPEKYTPSITIKTYDLYSKQETNDAALIGTRKGTCQDIETVTFNADGTEAYSDLIVGADGNPVNILTTSNGITTISAFYFTYTNVEGVETFKWNIGNITDKEIALSYMAYLKGSREGLEPDGLKYTNEGATLEYIDIFDKHATQEFPMPAVAWGGASTAYEFYLVNESGQPCNRNGDVVPFANRIIITGPFYQDLYLNQSKEEVAQEIIAVKVLPAGYTLYDDTAKYTVLTASGNNNGSLTISEPAEGKEQTTILVSAVTPSYIQSRVAFGVMYNEIPEESTFTIAPDRIVIDYGKEIVIDVNSNNEVPDDVTATLIGFSMFYDSIDVKHQFADTVYSTPFKGTYGTFSINEENNVVYEPHAMVNSVGKVFCVYEMTKGNDKYYMVSELDIIPATIMYYETDFADGVFKTANFGDTKTGSIAADGPQDQGVIGSGLTYGYDKSYENDADLSDGSSLFAEGQGVSTTTATFSFTGTGFDIISRTGAAQGLIKVQVATDSAMTNIIRTISVLNKSESELELYQIPVVSINGLDHGTYYVKVGVDAAFTNDTGMPALDVLNRGNEFYFDALRIYDPAKGNTTAEAAYNTDGEANNKIDEVRGMLISAGTFNALDGSTNGVVFVDNKNSGNTSASGEAGDVQVADYATIGPNNEVYLSNGQAIAFRVTAGSNLASFDIGAKSVQGSTAGLKVSIITGTDTGWVVTKEITSSTVQYIDLLTVVENNKELSKSFSGEATVVITNTADGVLSITDLKAGYRDQALTIKGDLQMVNTVSTMSIKSAAVDPYAISYTVDTATFEVAKAVLNGEMDVSKPEPGKPEPGKPEPGKPEQEVSKYDIKKASVRTTGGPKDRKNTITVVTSQEVVDIMVISNSVEIEPARITFKDMKKTGTREWTIVLPMQNAAAVKDFTLVGCGADGTAGNPYTVSGKH